MNRRKQAVALLMAGLLLVGLSGCGQKEVHKEPDYSALIEQPLDLALENLLDEAAVRAVTQWDVACLGVFDNGTQLLFSDESGAYQVMVQMINGTRQEFDEDVGQLDDLLSVENMGHVTWWHGETRQLMTYVEGYAISVLVSTGGDDMDVQPVATQLMTHILNSIER